MKNIFVTGGGGYVGSSLIPKLLGKNYNVTVLDLFIYGQDVLKPHKNLKCITGDIRDTNLLKEATKKIDVFIHLACISNDPSFELNPKLGKSINLDCFRPMVEICRNNNVKRFIYASSSSVYGVKNEKNVIENMSLEPLTDYSRFKMDCEKILKEYTSENFITVTARPATVCGYAPRQRLDVVVNILSNLAYHKRKVKIFGGNQLRPNIHIDDMTNAYLLLIEADEKIVNGEEFNIGFENQTVEEIALNVKKAIGDDVSLEYVPTDDNRSYHISSEKILNYLNFKPQYTVNDAINQLKNAFEKKILINTFTNDNYFNIKKMQSVKLK